MAGPVTPQTGTFPPAGPTTLTAPVPSYLYKQYDDDEDLQAFVRSFNELAQVYATWFADVGLPVYTGAPIAGALLDWVAAGLYGMLRPALSSGRAKVVGPYGTYLLGVRPLGALKLIGPSNATVTSDDVFKRIMTWNFYKGDGNRFTVRWLKRRVARFLTGENGTAPNIDQTYAISVTFGPQSVTIRIGGGQRKIVAGPVYGRALFGQMVPYGALVTQFESGPSPPAFASVFKQAMESGVLQVPFQYKFSVLVPTA